MLGLALAPAGSVRRLGRLITAAACAIVMLVAGAAPAFAVTKLGQTNENYLCSRAYEWIQTASRAAVYAARSNGKLTQWSINGGNDAGSVQFEVWRPVSHTNYKLLYISPSTRLAADKVTTKVLTSRITVRKGDVIGLRSVTMIDCALKTGLTSDAYAYNDTGVVPKSGATVVFNVGGLDGFRFNIAAVVA